MSSFASNSVPTAHTDEKEAAIESYMLEELGVSKDDIKSMELIGTDVKLKVKQFYANILQYSDSEKLSIGGVPQNIYRVKFTSEDNATCSLELRINLEDYNSVSDVARDKEISCI